MKPSLLLVDDDETICTQLKWALNLDYDVTLAGSRPEAMAAAGIRKPDIVLVDLGLPPNPADTTEGFLLLSELLTGFERVKVVVMTGQGEEENAIEAIGQGAYDFLNKPVDVDEVRMVVKRALYVSRWERGYREMHDQPPLGGFEGMLGDSPQIQNVFAAVRKVASVSAPVLLLGESGTGKEMVALAIHRQSSRRDGPFVAINCHAIPETLLESELFGHEKGAFTGAYTQRIGLIESASGGTLLLDEIGELTPSLQVKLLRFLQSQTFERVGGRQSIQGDTRVIAATNADLQKAMAEGRFREDLYFRTAVVTIRIPPLRERLGDSELLAKKFLRKYAAESNKDVTLSAKAVKVLSTYDWPGNVRELENRIRRAVVMVEGRLIKPADLELDGQSGVVHGMTLKHAREEVERDLIQHALAHYKNNISKTAEALEVSRPTLYELMDKLSIEHRNG